MAATVYERVFGVTVGLFRVCYAKISGGVRKGLSVDPFYTIAPSILELEQGGAQLTAVVEMGAYMH